MRRWCGQCTLFPPFVREMAATGRLGWHCGAVDAAFHWRHCVRNCLTITVNSRVLTFAIEMPAKEKAGRQQSAVVG